MDIFDILLPPFYLVLILLIGYKYSTKKSRANKVYKYFMPGLLAKIAGAVLLGLVYQFYYGGGDTINYYQTSFTLVNVLYDNPNDFFFLFFGDPGMSDYYLMNSTFSFTYWVNDPYAFFVAKCFVPILIVCGKSYMASAILVASICYLAVWRLFLVFYSEFAAQEKAFTWSILYMPSVVFWGSGLMKDSITFSATCLFVHGFYWFFARKKFRIRFIVALSLGTYLLLSIKPYILFALLPGSVLWFVTLRLHKVRSKFLRFMITPSLIFLSVSVGIYVLQSLGDSLGKYSFEKVISTASGAQQDLKQSYYAGNTFDIGDYEANVSGLLSVSHKAIFAALFRPTIFDVKNIVMFISALENTFILFFCIYLLFKLRFFKFFGIINSHPILLFSFLFSVFFAFSVGVSISNFGTLVRLKIPCIPFFLSSLVIMNGMLNEKKIPKADNVILQPAKG